MLPRLILLFDVLEIFILRGQGGGGGGTAWGQAGEGTGEGVGASGGWDGGRPASGSRERGEKWERPARAGRSAWTPAAAERQSMSVCRRPWSNRRAQGQRREPRVGQLLAQLAIASALPAPARPLAAPAPQAPTMHPQ